MTEHKPLGYCIQSSEKLRKLIMENPNMPIMVEVESELIFDDHYTSWIAPSINCVIGEVLDCDQTINDERIYMDRIEFEEDVYDWLDNTYYADKVMNGESGPLDDEVEQKAKEILAEYEPYWKKVIIIYAGT